MKLTETGKTLFAALCEMFVDKNGHKLSKRAFGEKTTLVATRDSDGNILKINLYFLTHNIMSIQAEPQNIFLDVTAWFHQASINRLNKVLSMVGMNIRRINGKYVISDNSGQQTQFKNAETLDLTRPHGSAIYPQVETPSAPQA